MAAGLRISSCGETLEWGAQSSMPGTHPTDWRRIWRTARRSTGISQPLIRTTNIMGNVPQFTFNVEQKILTTRQSLCLQLTDGMFQLDPDWLFVLVWLACHVLVCFRCRPRDGCKVPGAAHFHLSADREPWNSHNPITGVPCLPQRAA